MVKVLWVIFCKFSLVTGGRRSSCIWALVTFTSAFKPGGVPRKICGLQKHKLHEKALVWCDSLQEYVGCLEISAEPCSAGWSGMASWLIYGLCGLVCWTRPGKTLVGQLQEAPLLQGAEDHTDPWRISAERGCSRLPAQPSKHVCVRGSALMSTLPDFTYGALGWALDHGAVVGLPLLLLKSITPFPLGSLGTGPSAWLVVKTYNSCIHSSLVADRRTEREP